jgi:pancreatic triacylglycerol lipase
LQIDLYTLYFIMPIKLIGLDPASVLYGGSPIDERLDSSDAEYVEVVHTSGGYLGYVDSIGRVDFFPNGGAWPQPGCFMDFVGKSKISPAV